MGDWEDKKEERNKAALVLNQVPLLRWDLPGFLSLESKTGFLFPGSYFITFLPRVVLFCGIFLIHFPLSHNCDYTTKKFELVSLLLEGGGWHIVLY